MSDICYLCLRIMVSCVACLVSYKRWELLTLSGHLCSPMFLVGSVFLIFLVFCVVCFVLLVFLLPVALACSFWIAPSVVSYVFLLEIFG